MREINPYDLGPTDLGEWSPYWSAYAADWNWDCMERDPGDLRIIVAVRSRVECYVREEVDDPYDPKNPPKRQRLVTYVDTPCAHVRDTYEPERRRRLVNFHHARKLRALYELLSTPYDPGGGKEVVIDSGWTIIKDEE